MVGLHHLVGIGLLERRQRSERSPRYEFVPIEAGRHLEPVLRAPVKWGLKWTKLPSAELSS